jgi:hypothetical protein
MLCPICIRPTISAGPDEPCRFCAETTKKAAPSHCYYGEAFRNHADRKPITVVASDGTVSELWSCKYHYAAALRAPAIVSPGMVAFYRKLMPPVRMHTGPVMTRKQLAWERNNRNTRKNRNR